MASEDEGFDDEQIRLAMELSKKEAAKKENKQKEKELKSKVSNSNYSYSTGAFLWPKRDQHRCCFSFTTALIIDALVLL